MTAALHRVRDSLQGAPDPDRRRQLQRILYGLYAIIRLHFAKEEGCLPVLDAGLGSAEAADVPRHARVRSCERLGTTTSPRITSASGEGFRAQSWEEKHRGASRK